MRAAASLEEPGEFAVPPTVVFRPVCGSPVPEAFLPSTEPDEPCGSVARLTWAPGRAAAGSRRAPRRRGERSAPVQRADDPRRSVSPRPAGDRPARPASPARRPARGRPAAPADRPDRRALARGPRAGAVLADTCPYLRRLLDRDGYRLTPDDRGDPDVHAGLPDGGHVRRPAGHSRVPLPRQAPPDRHPLPPRRARRARGGRAGGESRRASCRTAASTGACSPGAPTTTSSASPGSRARGRPAWSGRSRRSWWSAGSRPSARRSPPSSSPGRWPASPGGRASASPDVEAGQEADRHLGVDARVVHARRRARRLRRRAGDLRQLPRLRRDRSRARAPEPPGLRGPARGRPVAPPDRTRPPPRARAPLRPLRPRGPRAGVVHPLFRDGRRAAVRARVLRPDPPERLAAPPASGTPRRGRRDEPSRRRRRTGRRERRRELGFDPYLDVRESCERDGIRVVSAGPNAFVYFVDTPEPVPLEAIEARWPGLAAALSKSAGVGFVLARAADGPVCFWRGQAIAWPIPRAAPSRSGRTARSLAAGPGGPDGHAERRRPRRLRHRRARGARVLHRRGRRPRGPVARGAPHVRRGAAPTRRSRPGSTIRSSSTSCSSATSRRHRAAAA